ncbi:MAG: histidine phosphatase family protein [Lachnospiraceae bacterium]|nr:histidine phosphatase family protein [Lachnospiraceae bacterium]MCH4031970.1 histidine phosphatase family protein [Lachnospiraceae bacterium]MCH4070589.1 histidine phosphatase family protein [Lachnospiraceae bacterium]MCH4109261.1 histidine phosphatase family protein [Lachnospiraceae bacterium]MCI1302906.1 histidine phosphatase family protein [Lachnospiraceae bacterium]
MNIFLLRHGMTEGNRQHRYVGSTDEALLPEAVEHLSAAAPVFQKTYLADKSVLVLTSPLRRCVQTAQLLTAGLSLARGEKSAAEADGRRGSYVSFREVAAFRETDFGTFEYRNYAELNGDPDYQRFIDSGGETAFPGGESRKEAAERVTAAFVSQVKLLPAPEPDVLLLVVHGGTIMALMERFAVPRRSFYDWQCANLSGFTGALVTSLELKIVEVGKLCL